MTLQLPKPICAIFPIIFPINDRRPGNIFVATQVKPFHQINHFIILNLSQHGLLSDIQTDERT